MTRITFCRVLAGLFFISLAAPAAADTFFVQARPDNTFSPANLSIAAGDSVTFTNAGGFHNVVASNGSFRCANGCDGMGGNGDAASNEWMFTMVFATPGVIPYICEIHEFQGMVGTISVCTGRDLVLAQQTVPDTQAFTALNTIATGPAFAVASLGVVTLKAAGTVALRNGTSVASGGKLTVENSAMPCN